MEPNQITKSKYSKVKKRKTKKKQQTKQTPIFQSNEMETISKQMRARKQQQQQEKKNGMYTSSTISLKKKIQIL